MFRGVVVDLRVGPRYNEDIAMVLRSREEDEDASASQVLKAQCAVAFYFFKSCGGGSLGVSWMLQGRSLERERELHRDCSVASISRSSLPLLPRVLYLRFCRHACYEAGRRGRPGGSLRAIPA